MFASNKLVSILLYVIFGISVLVIAFFYFGENLVDEAAFNAKVTRLETSDESLDRPIAVIQKEEPADTLIEEPADTLVSDTAAVISAPVAPNIPISPAAINFSFMEKLVYNKTDIALAWAYFLVGITLLIAFIFPLIHMFSSTKNLVQTLGILVVAAIIIGIAYMFSSATPLYIPGYEGTDNSNPGVLKFVDTAWFTTYFLIGLALLSILYTEVAKYLK